jgi:hypothetical protein
VRWKNKKYDHQEGEKEIIIRFAWVPQEGPDGVIYWLERLRVQRTWEWVDHSVSPRWYAHDLVIGPAEEERV